MKKCPLKVDVKVFKLTPMSSWPQGAILAIADLSATATCCSRLYLEIHRVPNSQADPKALLGKYRADTRKGTRTTQD